MKISPQCLISSVAFDVPRHRGERRAVIVTACSVFVPVTGLDWNFVFLLLTEAEEYLKELTSRAPTRQ